MQPLPLLVACLPVAFGCVCEPPSIDGKDYIPWIGTYFGACAYSTRDIVGFAFGMTNIFIWLFAQAPQLYLNYVTGSVESLSALFLVIWLLGDLTNLVGCLLTKQAASNLWTAYYFLFMDCLLMSQYIYYSWVRRRVDKHSEEDVLAEALIHSDSDIRRAGLVQDLPPEDEVGSLPDSSGDFSVYSLPLLLILLPLSGGCLVAVSPSLSSVASSSSFSSFFSPASLRPGKVLLEERLCNAASTKEGWEVVVGDVAAWVSGVLYFTARVPQIWTNYVRKSCQGLSFLMFASTTFANIFYGIGMVLPDNSTPLGGPELWRNQIPYLLGSVGTIATSGTILVQFYTYAPDKARLSSSQAALRYGQIGSSLTPSSTGLTPSSTGSGPFLIASRRRSSGQNPDLWPKNTIYGQNSRESGLTYQGFQAPVVGAEALPKFTNYWRPYLRATARRNLIRMCIRVGIKISDIIIGPSLHFMVTQCRVATVVNQIIIKSLLPLATAPKQIQGLKIVCGAMQPHE
eukprot:g2852.t1